MIPWGWLIVAFACGAWLGLVLAGLLRAAGTDMPRRWEGTE
ncbi:MAG: hypothetical protein ACPLRW_13590 [Moorellales bacterium]